MVHSAVRTTYTSSSVRRAPPPRPSRLHAAPLLPLPARRLGVVVRVRLPRQRRRRARRGRVHRRGRPVARHRRRRVRRRVHRGGVRKARHRVQPPRDLDVLLTERARVAPEVDAAVRALGALRVVPYERMTGWSSKASGGVQRRRGRALKARGGRRDAPGKVLKDRRSPRDRGRMGTSVWNAPESRTVRASRCVVNTRNTPGGSRTAAASPPPTGSRATT